MALNAIQLAEIPAVEAVQPARVKPTPVPADKRSAPPPPSTDVSSRVSASEEIRLQWDGDYGVIVKFTDARSGEVLRQIPSDQILGVVRFIRQMLEAEGGGRKEPALIPSGNDL